MAVSSITDRLLSWQLLPPRDNEPHHALHSVLSPPAGPSFQGNSLAGPRSWMSHNWWLHHVLHAAQGCHATCKWLESGQDSGCAYRFAPPHVAQGPQSAYMQGRIS